MRSFVTFDFSLPSEVYLQAWKLRFLKTVMWRVGVQKVTTTATAGIIGSMRKGQLFRST